MSSEILSLLRAATVEAHGGLEKLVDVESRLRSRTAYAHLLRGLAGFYLPLEAELETVDWGRTGLDWESRRKSGWLLEDLAELGCDTSILPWAGDVPHMASSSFALGALYVVEGATLGGRQVLGMMQAAGVADWPARYFGNYSENRALRWREFTELLERQPQDHAESIVQGAVHTFRGLHRWLAHSLALQ